MLVTVGGWDAKVSVLDGQGTVLGEESGSGQPDVELELPADGEYYLRVHSAGEYILMPALQRVFDTTGRSRDLMFANAEFGPYDRLYNRTYRRADGTQLRWKWGEFNKSIVEEELRDGQVVATHTITKGQEGHLLMDGKVDGVLSRRDGVVVGDHVDWGGSYGISVRAADRKLRRETMGATEYLELVEE